ncbi:MAG: DUF4340 domain-containing protein [Elusimicrobiota bacterium]
MKKFKLTYVLVLAAILLGSYVYFFEKEEITTTGKEVYVVKEDQINKFLLEQSGQPEKKELQGEKIDGKWWITAPKKYETDEGEINTLLQKLAKPESDREIEKKPADLKIYGLEIPSFQATVWLVDGSSRSFVVGDETPIRGSFYLKNTAGATVYTIASAQLAGFKKETKDLRKKNIMEIETEKIEQLEIVSRAKKIFIEKTGGKWYLKKPKEFEVTASGVEGLLNTLKNLWAQSFVEDEPKNLKIYGLDKPQLTARVWQGKEKAVVAILVGDKLKDKEEHYARREGLAPVYTVSAGFLKDLDRDPNEIRDRQVLNKDLSGFDKIEIQTNQGKKIVCQIEKTDKTEKWFIVQPNKIEADAEISVLASQLGILYVSIFTDDQPAGLAQYGLEQPVYTVSVHKQNNLLRTFLLGKEKDSNVYLKTADQQSVYQVDKNILDKIAAALKK